ncbi:cache domain-containing protein, partial [Rhizobium helianthi]
MKRLSIPTQLALLVGGLIFAFSIATFVEIRSSSNAIYQQRYEMLRTQVESAISILKDFNDRATAGEFTQEEAQKRAYALLNKVKFEPDGYFFGYDYDVKMIFHPTSPDVGKSNKGKGDPTGYLYRDELVRLAQQGGGFVEFIGPKPGKDPNDRTYPKASYAKAFEPWKIVIITGLYTDDLKAEIRAAIFQAIGTGLVILGLAIGAAYFIIRGITRPLSAIHDALGAVADE